MEAMLAQRRPERVRHKPRAPARQELLHALQLGPLLGRYSALQLALGHPPLLPALAVQAVAQALRRAVELHHQPRVRRPVQKAHARRLSRAGHAHLSPLWLRHFVVLDQFEARLPADRLSAQVPRDGGPPCNRVGVDCGSHVGLACGRPGLGREHHGLALEGRATQVERLGRWLGRAGGRHERLELGVGR